MGAIDPHKPSLGYVRQLTVRKVAICLLSLCSASTKSTVIATAPEQGRYLLMARVPATDTTTTATATTSACSSPITCCIEQHSFLDYRDRLYFAVVVSSHILREQHELRRLRAVGVLRKVQCADGRINHCTGCTKGRAPPPPQGGSPMNCQIFTALF